jgi:hypothetical protein
VSGRKVSREILELGAEILVCFQGNKSPFAKAFSITASLRHVISVSCTQICRDEIKFYHAGNSQSLHKETENLIKSPQ